MRTAQHAWEKSCYFNIDYKIDEASTVYDAISRMSAYNVGCLIVTKNGVVSLRRKDSWSHQSVGLAYIANAVGLSFPCLDNFFPSLVVAVLRSVSRVDTRDIFEVLHSIFTLNGISGAKRSTASGAFEKSCETHRIKNS